MERPDRKGAGSGRDVVLIERESIPGGASGRNGGVLTGSFVDPYNLPFFPRQEQLLLDLARDNRSEIEQALDRHEIDCDFEATGEVYTGTRPWHLDRLRDVQRLHDAADVPTTYLDTQAIRAELRSDQFLAGISDPEAAAIIHPGKLAWGLKRACERLGVRIFERTPGVSLQSKGGRMLVKTPYGSVTATNVILGTYAHPSLIKRLRKWRIPLYSHVLMTEPLTSEQHESIGWRNRQAFIDIDTVFYYYRLTKDNRILWGILDASLHWNRGVRPEFEQDLQRFGAMAEDFLVRFPQLEGIQFSHRWGGAVDVTSRPAPFFGTANPGGSRTRTVFWPGSERRARARW